ncbi:hypothetical protein F4777DRAFT_583176 [Nemania sp. FL0916]|nr:hypothetical protein F4777DRAFT_583176 [Nemania sp. FL0916]
MVSVNQKRTRIFMVVAIVCIALVQFMPRIEYRIVPSRKQDFVRQYLKARTSDVFSTIYKGRIWGKDTSETPFYSGAGSHDADAVEPYVASVRSWILQTFINPPNVADLGCGDFNIGRQIRNVTDRYIACDIVPDLIDYNRLAFADQNVDFRVLDMISEGLPAADVVFVRQVLQHLDNEGVAYIIPKLYQYKWAVITEHIPLWDDFVPNVDILTGNVRILVNSGLDLTKPPFHLQHYGEKIICEARASDGRIRTTAYKLRES